MPVKRRRKPAVEAAEVRMPALVTKEGCESPPPIAQGFLSKVRLLRVSQVLRRGRKA